MLLLSSPGRRGTLLSLLLGALACAGCRSGAFPSYPADYREYAYIANGGSDTVTVLDLVHVRQEQLLKVGAHPRALLANPTRNEVYAAAGALSIIDAERNAVVARLPLGKQPSAMALDPAGRRLYVANEGGNSVSVLDLDHRRVVGVAGVGEGPADLAVTSDGATLVVANRASGSVSLMDLPQSDTAGKSTPPADLPRLRSSFSGCPGATGIALLPDGSKAFIACSQGHQVLVLGLKTDPQKRSLQAPESDRLLALLDVGTAPVRLAVKPDGGEIFVVNQGANSISEIATGTNEVGGAAVIGQNPAFGIVSSDNSLLWVANRDADTVAVYAIDDGKLVNTVHVGSGPGPMVFSADGHLLLAADTRSGDVSLLRTFSRNLHREPVYGSLFTLLPAGSEPVAMVDKAFRVSR